MAPGDYRGNPSEGKWDLAKYNSGLPDDLKNDKFLKKALPIQVTKFLIESLAARKYPQFLPHKTYKLILHETVTGEIGTEEKTAYGFRVSIQLAWEGVTSKPEGFGRIKYLDVDDDKEVTATFEVPDWKPRPLWQVLDFLKRGTEAYDVSKSLIHRGLSGAMDNYRFKKVHDEPIINDGCRDWVLQVYLRLEALGWVGKKILGPFPGKPDAKGWPTPRLVLLSEVIDKHYFTDNGGNLTKYESRPLAAGEFLSTSEIPPIIRQMGDIERAIYQT